MGPPAYLRSSGKSVRAPAVARGWLVLAVLGTALVVLVALTWGQALFVLEAWLQAGLILPILVAATMLGLLATVPLARAGVFDVPALGSAVAAARTTPAPSAQGWRLVLSLGLGLGGLALGMLALGSLHLLGYGLPALLLVVAVAAAYVPTRDFLRQMGWNFLKAPAPPGTWIILIVGLPLATLLIAAAFPPGTLWNSEGRGYDVLEYHLQLPREYAQNNSTAPLAHNVYSFLPANTEMLYLLVLSLLRALQPTANHLIAIYPSQMLHATLTVAAAAATALLPIRLSTLGRLAAFVTVLAVPWTLVTGSLAYNEAGVLLYTALALGLALGPRGAGRWAWAVPVTLGILLGLAVGCKMTAGVLTAVPVAALLMVQGRWRTVLLAAVVAGAVYAPWALRSMRATGNPIFPIAARTLGLGHWTAEQAERWDRGHQPKTPAETRAGQLAANHQPLAAAWTRAAGRLGELAWQYTDPQWSPGVGTFTGPSDTWASRVGILWLLVPIAVVLALVRSLAAWQLLLAAAVQMLGWMLCTHLQARFLLPTLIPLAVLVGLGLGPSRWFGPVAWALLGLQALCCPILLWQETRPYGPPPPPRPPSLWQALRSYIPAAEQRFSLAGLPPDQMALPDRLATVDPPPDLPDSITTCLEGESGALYYHGHVIYHTVFDADPLAEAVRVGGPAQAAAYLRAQGVDYLVVNFVEINRLAGTYGFAPEITPEAMAAMGFRPAFPTHHGIVVYAVNAPAAPTP